MKDNKDKRYAIYSNAKVSFGTLKGYLEGLYKTMNDEIHDLQVEIASLKHTIEHKDAEIFQRDRTIKMYEEGITIKKKAM